MFTRDDLATVLADAPRAPLFIAKVKMGPEPAHDPDLGPCLLRDAGVTKSGYARFRTSPARTGPTRMYAHVWVFEQVVGPVEDGHQLDHLCHHRDYCTGTGADCLHRRCVNPGHLRQVTPRFNTLISGNFIAFQVAQTECLRGHPLIESNIGRYPSAPTSRQCLTCARIRKREYVALKSARLRARQARTRPASWAS